MTPTKIKTEAMDLRQRGSTGVSSGGPLSTSLNKKRRRKKSANNALVGVCALVVVVLLVGGGFVFITGTTKQQSSIAASSGRGLSEKETEKLRTQIESLKNELKAAKKQLSTAAKQVVSPSTTDKKLDGKQMKLFKYYKTSKIHEKQAIKAILKRQLADKYGPDPHFVEIVVAFDPASNIANTTAGANDIGTILIELAPSNDMPATVFWFLEQVNASLYDGASFHRNAGHVVQGGPVANFESKGQDIMKKFEDAGLTGVPFQEYSPKFPHVKYTLGYAGRPGGPDFYVSTKDNSRNHGPGGQDSYDDPSEADPCFAKVVSGVDVVDRMAKASVEPGWYRRIEKYIAIRSMRIVSPSYAANFLAGSPPVTA